MTPSEALLTLADLTAAQLQQEITQREKEIEILQAFLTVKIKVRPVPTPVQRVHKSLVIEDQIHSLLIEMGPMKTPEIAEKLGTTTEVTVHALRKSKMFERQRSHEPWEVKEEFLHTKQGECDDEETVD